MTVLDSAAPPPRRVFKDMFSILFNDLKKIKEMQKITIVDQSKKLFVLPVPLFFLFPGVRQFQRNATKAFGSKNL